MKALDEDPAAAMMALADEAEQEWEKDAPERYKGLLSATDDEST